MLVQAIDRAFKTMHERNWDTVYWAIDLHGVCFNSTYEHGNYAFINSATKDALVAISENKYSKIILWSSCYLEEQKDILRFFKENGIDISYFNENPEAPNTKTGSFSQKFYFSILLDDKAGFDPAKDWGLIKTYLDLQYTKELEPQSL